ncbi:hypothetical protein [Streptomyces agglomeratus]|uniref:hypothetical protein n=1 Tax=Streptomyces agglomeratus TaxID=285458 RepID=UPI000A7A0FA4|nr:hypothetical protein [Streptomyces agglomeratus]
MALGDPHPHPDSGHGVPAEGAEAAGRQPLPEAEPLAGDELLPCGRPLSRAWEEARDGKATADSHTTRCPYCRQAVDGLAALDEASRALRDKERPPGHSLAERVINAVRAEVRLGALLPLDDSAHDVRIAESAAARVLRRAADTVPGARAASCRLTATGNGTAVHITMTLAAALDQPLPDRAARVRRAVLQAADHELGLAVSDLDLKIDTVLDPAVVSSGGPTKRSGQR